ncbi:MAG: hypothetical protein AAGA43_00765 [Bacteroidota bacterium]
MKKSSLSALFVLLVFSSCNSDDDVSALNQINGTWNLARVTDGFAGVNIAYSRGDVVWIFNEASKNLDVMNLIENTGPEDIYSGPDTGSYTYEITSEDEIETLRFNNADRGTFTIVNDSLIINKGIVSEGAITIFIR